MTAAAIVNPNAGIGLWESITEGSNKVVTKTEGVEKLSKVIRAVARFAIATFAAASALCANVIDRFTTIIDFCGALNIVNRIYEWSCVKFHTWQKVASRVFLTASNAVESFLWLGKLGLYNLGKIAASAGALSGVLGTVFRFLPIAKDGFAAVAFGFSTWNNAREIGEANEKIKEAKDKLDKWVAKKVPHDAVSDVTKAEENKKLLDKYQAKLDKLVSTDVPEKTKDWKKQAADEYKIAKIKRLEKYIAEINDGKSDALTVNRTYKVELYSAQIQNKNSDKKKCWLGITMDVLKIAIITIGTALVLTNVATAATIIGMAAFGLVVDGFGGFKFVWDDCIFKKVAEPTNPYALAAPAA